MYYCKSCDNTFSSPEIITETHGLSSPPYERFAVCPYCSSSNFSKVPVKYCRCCGARLRYGVDDYCSETCKANAEKLRIEESKRKERIKYDPVSVIVKELENYNKEHNSNISYGEYMVLIRPHILKDKKCKTQEV